MTQLLLVAAMAVLGWQVVAGQDPKVWSFSEVLPRYVDVIPQPDHAAAPPPPGGRCYVGFSVRKANNDTLRSNSRVYFQDVLTNTGGWLNSLGEFQAPCKGFYYFSFHAVSPPTSDFTLTLMKNNRYQVTAYGSSTDYQQASNSALLFLNTGDLVHLQLQQGILYEHPGQEAYTAFSGYIVGHM